MSPVVWYLVLLITLFFLSVEFHALWLQDWIIALVLRAVSYTIIGSLVYLSTLASEQYGHRHTRTRALREALCWLLWQEVGFFLFATFLLVNARLYTLVALVISLLAALITTSSLYESTPVQTHVIV